MAGTLIYMDYSSTTPVDPLVLEAMMPYFSTNFGNASSLYNLGRGSHEAMDVSRENIAKLMGAEPSEIIFTSGGTEGDNLCIKGIAHARKDKGKHIITSAIEHPAVLRSCQYLEKNGFEVTYLPVNNEGIILLSDLESALRDDTTLVTVMMANNEIGTIQEIGEMSRLAHERGALMHTDAVQTCGRVPIDVNDLGVDLLTISGHKFYGPKGVGAIYLRKGTRLEPMIHGGGHEKNIRSGTENIPGMVGMGKAAELASERMMQDNPRIQSMRDKLIDDILNNIDESFLNGHCTKRLSNNVNVRFSHIEGEGLILNLDFNGIEASTGSACSSKSLQPSHVLLAIGLKHEEAHGSLRLSLGRNNTDEDVDRVLEVLPGIVQKLRKMSPLSKEAGYVQ